MTSTKIPMTKRVTIPQFLIGIIFGLLIVLVTVGGVGYLYFLRLSQKPDKPDFPAASKVEEEEPSDADIGPSDDSYVAIVVYPDGLILREDPDSNSEVVTTLNFEETVRILEVSPDEKWEKVFLETTGQDGWVARGNTKRVQ